MVASANEAPARPRARRIVLVCALTLLPVLLAAALWVGVRGLLARGELAQAQSVAATLQNEIVTGDETAAGVSYTRLAGHAAEAAQLTSDPVWRLAETVPVFGRNLAVVRQLAAGVDDVARQSIQPLTEVAGSVTPASLAPVDGAVNVEPLVQAQPAVAAATSALLATEQRLAGIEGAGLLPPVRDALGQVQGMAARAADSLSAVNSAVQLLPAMVGADGPRNYLVLFQNPAELRSTGGLSGALAVVHAESGRLELAQQAGATELPIFDSPVLPLPPETLALYRDRTGRYVGDVNLTPNFALSAELAREMWNRRFGVQVDGVLAIDPVALSYLLAATGPVTLPSGDVLTADNAVQLLLTGVYERYSVPLQQDAFFAAAAASVFEVVSAGRFSTGGMLAALQRAGAEHRVLLWSAHPEEQAVLSTTSLGGGLPVSDAHTTRFGVYLNDATGAKMDTFLRVQVGAAKRVCREDGRPTYAVEVTLTNTAPADAAATLPESITGDGSFGVPRGNVKTLVTVYGAPGLQNLGVARDGAVVGYHPTTDSAYPAGATYPVSSLDVELAPGQSTALSFGWLGVDEAPELVVTEITPAIHLENKKIVGNFCESAVLC
ncbi:DUF4012 domain-containing protein [Cryobacterium roopkundense]|uniref:DUF4012 domain-containing protein n=1 Tax=Cryobacterium roopkundense TaxID=1001240 RepID=A0A7W8ZY38_9MICO|nr:DUF4012 domain-containing protein [Cryobacterium roopkundense]MBB5642374.1 hypothetical protein [Cryobacterium roopkundense]